MLARFELFQDIKSGIGFTGKNKAGNGKFGKYEMASVFIRDYPYSFLRR